MAAAVEKANKILERWPTLLSQPTAAANGFYFCLEGFAHKSLFKVGCCLYSGLPSMKNTQCPSL